MPEKKVLVTSRLYDSTLANQDSSRRMLLIIDGNAVVHRAFHALPLLTTKKGELVNAVYGFLLVFLRAVREFKPDYVAATFDTGKPTFRHEKFKEYKAKRPPAPQELIGQLPKIKDILNAFGISCFEKPGFEADDIIGTISRLAPKKQVLPEIETIILSGDLDVLQLVDKNTKAYILRKGLKDTILYSEEQVKERYGLVPEQLVDFRALRGDPSDNIPGITGIGEKTAIELLKEFGSLENIYEAIEEKTEKAKETNVFFNEKLKKIKPATKEKLIQYKEQAFFSKTLAEIDKNVPIDFDLKECSFKKYDKEKAAQALREYEFFSLISRLPSFEEPKESKSYQLF